MILRLTPLPDTICGPDDPAYKGRVPSRARFLQPAAGAAFLRLEADTGGLVYNRRP